MIIADTVKERIWLPTQLEYDVAQAERIRAKAARRAECDIAEALGH